MALCSGWLSFIIAETNFSDNSASRPQPRNHHVAGDGRAFGDPGDLGLLFRGKQQVGILAGARRIDQTGGHGLHRLLVTAGKEDPAKEILGCIRSR